MEMKTPLRLLIQRWGYLDPQDRAFAGLQHEEEDGEVIEAEGLDVPAVDDVTPEPEPEKPTRSQATDELMGTVNSNTKYKTIGTTIITRISKANGIPSPEVAPILTGMIAGGSLPAEITLAEADELAKRINA